MNTNIEKGFKFKFKPWRPPSLLCRPPARRLGTARGLRPVDSSIVHEGVTECAPHPAHAPFISRMRARARAIQVRRCGWSDARMAESPRGLAARWVACGLEMDDELTGGPSAAREEAECMSDMASDDAHDELLCSMDVVAEVHAQDAEREQQREGCL